jgi:RNA polymerase sigma-70 factor (ECF subfamily)
LDAARAGDRGSLNELLQRHQDRIYAVCRRLTGNDADALDATQETLIAIVRGLPRFDGRSAFSTWCFRIATNTCIDEFRRRERRPALSLDTDDTPLDRHDGVNGESPDLVADRIDIDQALEQLPWEFRTAVVLRDLLGLEYTEIGTILDVAPGTVRSRIARGRSRLADLLTSPDERDGNQTTPGQRPTSEP